MSPLIALMRNQVAQLCANGIAAASLYSANDPAENRAILERIGRGELRLVYVAPERLLKSDTLDLFKRANVTLLAVDEAHCISQWGHDFRPEYAALGTVQSEFGRRADGGVHGDGRRRDPHRYSRQAVCSPAGLVRAWLRPPQPAPAMRAKAGGRTRSPIFSGSRGG